MRYTSMHMINYQKKIKILCRSPEKSIFLLQFTASCKKYFQLSAFSFGCREEQLWKLNEGKVVLENAVTFCNNLRCFNIYRQRIKKKKFLLYNVAFVPSAVRTWVRLERLSLELFQRYSESRLGSLIKTHTVPYRIMSPLGSWHSTVEVGLNGFIKRAQRMCRLL